MIAARFSVLLFAIFLILCGFAPEAVAASPESCSSAKLKGVGKRSKLALKCHVRAAKRDQAVDVACLDKAAAKFDARFVKTEAKGGCLTEGDANAVGSDIDRFVSDVANALTHGSDVASRKCAARKRGEAGKKASRFAICYAKAAKRAETVDGACLGKSDTRFDQGFDKAEAAGECATTMDAAAIAAEVDAIVAGAVADLMAVCGDSIAGPGETCDGPDDGACPGQCAASCVCSGDCGDGVAGPGEECDGADDGACPGLCQASCVCGAMCGDGVAGPGEDCDGADDMACPGQCQVSCVCGGDCGDGFAEEPSEQCDDGNTASGDGCSSTCQLEDASALCAGVAFASGASIDSEVVASGFDRPVHLTAPPLDTHRLFVVEQDGLIRIIEDGAVLPTPFLDIRSRVAGPSSSNERGLLSLAFHPAYASNKRFFVNYTRSAGGAANGDTVIARFRVSGNPNVAAAGSEEILIVIDQFAGNHNGGQIAFDSEGLLYVGMGDGGGGGDPQETGQDDTRLLGKMLRLDVDVETSPYYAVPFDNPDAGAGDPLGLVWAKGLRNPWRFSFDRANGDLYIGDVGQNAIEEVSYAPGTSTGGENYGWDIFEGTSCFEPTPAPDCPDPPTGFTFPITEYGHSEGCSITGGFVYRGCALPDLHGTYFYGDFCTNFVRTLEVVGGAATNEGGVTSAFGGVGSISSFGEDARGELYVLGFDGTVRRMIPAAP
ncbi:MAG: PQQ-dependent sugar dehydrogenase [Candidatus Binatia bacterium]